MSGDSKRILIATEGSRGDIQPYIALALAFQEAAKHEVALCTHEFFQNLVQEQQIPDRPFKFLPTLGDVGKVMASEELKKALYEGSTLDALNVFKKAYEEGQDENNERLFKHSNDFKPDLLVVSITLASLGVAIAEYHKIPLIVASTVPAIPCGDYPPILIPSPFRFKWANRAAHWALNKLGWRVLGPKLNEFRKSKGLPTQKQLFQSSIPYLCMYSQHVIPQPKDYPATAHYTGYWTLPAPEVKDESELPKGVSQELFDFLNKSEEKPIYVGFGSMPLRDTNKLMKDVAQASRELGVRCIFYACWSKDLDTESIFKEVYADVPREQAKDRFLATTTGAPHEWLLPRCVAGVVHGGAGTVAATLRAGIPCCIFSVFGDQAFWGVHCARLGVGVADPIPLKEVTYPVLKDKIAEVLQPEIKQKAAAMGEKLRQENGVQEAVRLISEYATMKSFKTVAV